MPDFEIVVSDKTARSLLRLAKKAPHRIQAAQKSAGKKAARDVKTDISKKVREELFVKVKSVKRRLEVIAKPDYSAVRISRPSQGSKVSPYPLLSSFGRPSWTYRGGVKVTVRRGQQESGGKLKRAFIRTARKSGVELIQKRRKVMGLREGPKGGKLLALKGPSVLEHVVNKPGLMHRIRRDGLLIFDKKLGQQIAFELKKLTKAD